MVLTVLMVGRWRRLLVVLVVCGSVMVVPVVPLLMAPVVWVVRRGCSAMVAPVVRVLMVAMVAPVVLAAGGWVLVVMAALVVLVSLVVLVVLVVSVVMALVWRSVRAVTVVLVAMARWVLRGRLLVLG
ncbi:hypothetical protein [Mycobacterium sp. SMC-15]|uniref:hypothetical protein n=1 Tax=Mycobacterium sp. SMC-15 TaxID=3381627 RepID=UPI003875CCD6